MTKCRAGFATETECLTPVTVNDYEHRPVHLTPVPVLVSRGTNCNLKNRNKYGMFRVQKPSEGSYRM